MSAVARSSQAWECSRDRRGCVTLVFSDERPLACGVCGLTNTFVEQSAAARTRGGRRRPLAFGKAAASPVTAPGAIDAPATTAAALAASPDALEALQEAGDPPLFRWASDVELVPVDRATSDWREWRYVTGDLPRRHLTLFGGPRGTGKSRVLLQVAGGVVRTMRRPVVYLSEQDPLEWRTYAEAICPGELGPGGVALLSTRTLEELELVVRQLRPALIYVDALKRATFGGVECTPSSVAEREATKLLLRLAAESDAAVVATLHMQSDGEKYSVGGGPQQDCSLIVRVEKIDEPPFGPPAAVRLFVDGKNRAGAADRVAFLEHHDNGLRVHSGAPNGGLR